MTTKNAAMISTLTRQGLPTFVARPARIMASALLLVALVLGMIVMQSVSGTDAHSETISPAPVIQTPPVETAAHGSVETLTSATLPIVDSDTSTSAAATPGEPARCKGACTLGCDLAGVACSLGFVALAVSVVARVHDPVLNPGIHRLHAFLIQPRIVAPPLTPSLNLLSISRT